MRIVMISLAAAASALAFATPAAAQYYPQPRPQAFGYGQGNFGHYRALQVRVDSIQRQIVHLRARRMLNRNEASNLSQQSRNIERRLRRAAQYGLSPYEAQDVQVRIARLEQRLFRDVNDGRRWGQGYNNQGYSDRDRDGRNDRWEDDRGRDRDD